MTVLDGFAVRNPSRLAAKRLGCAEFWVEQARRKMALGVDCRDEIRRASRDLSDALALLGA